ncbi:MAG: carbohydrate kinase [Fretibacterium sp.]|nr:carbohydrate kinase [Fretibacterium sp.]
MNDLYSIGEMVIDFIPGAPHQGDVSYIRKAGGAPANVAIAVSKNGLSASMCCKVGDDDFGRFLTETLEEFHVRAACPEPCSEAITTMAFVTLDKDGDRKFTFARKPGADMFLSEADVSESDIRDSVIIHAGSCSLSAEPEAAATVKALRLGSDLDKLVSFDVNYRDLMWNKDMDACAEAVRGILPCVDLLKVSDAEVGMLGGEGALPALMERYGITIIVETLGASGAQAFFNGGIIRVPGLKVHAVDATGCGDAFWGAFLSKLRFCGVVKADSITEDIIRSALEYGNVSGCICVQSKGAIASIPTRNQIEDYMKNLQTEGNGVA